MFIPVTLIAQIPTITYTQGKYQALAPDWSKITWDTLPPVQQPGYLSIPQNLIRVFGYDPSRSWSAGQKVDSVVMLGDADDAFKMSSLSLKSISSIAPSNNKLTLKDFGLIQWQTPTSLVKSIPSLGNLSIRQVPPIAALLSRNGVLSNGNISQILRSNPQAANLPLGKLDLSKYSLNSIPGLTSTTLVKFKSWQQSYINQVPGLNQVPFDKMPQPINSGIGVVGIASVVLGTSERGDAYVGNNYFISGSVVRGDKTVPISILGLQNLSMLIESYGENTTNAIFGGCATKAFFNPQDDVAAERFSNFLGEEEIKYKQRSRSSGGKGGASISNSDQNSTRKLFDVNQFNTLPEGKAVIISPGFRSRGQISLPILQSIKIPQHEIQSEADSVKAWYEFQKFLSKESTLLTPADEEMIFRRSLALKLLPLIENKEQLSDYASLI